MRLTCPSCAAQYEVPADAIPPMGREVQCSACRHGWFEQPAESRPQLVDPEPWDSLPREDGGAEEADDLAELRAAPSLPPEATAARARVAPEVERILREEAAHEAQVRAEEATRRAAAPAAPAVPEIDADVPQIARPTRPLSREAERPAPRPAPPSPPPAARPTARPARQVDRAIDLDRINSTLRIHGDQIGAKPPQLGPQRRRRSGFAGGFWGSIAILVLLAGLYLFRPQIVEVAPQSAALLDPYARVVDQGRFWLDREVGRLVGVTPGG